ncbi:MAG: hypothetical protein K9J13_11925 [Saprospiraceae bacterium]|nr:hypothetical protein [Saprospiraceae bacterium]
MDKKVNLPLRSLKECYDLTRHPERIRSSDVIEGVFEDIEYFESPDPSLIVARGKINGTLCMILGQEKRRSGKESLATGMMNSKGYGFTLDMLDKAEKNTLPVISFIDTFGGDTSIESELGGQSFLISDCISRYCEIKTPTISIVIGEGGSGGALGLQIADKAYMLENSLYSVIAPESCSRIIFQKRLAEGENLEDTISDSLEVLQPGANHIQLIGMIDEILPEPVDGAHTNYDFTINIIKKTLIKDLTKWTVAKKDGTKIVRSKIIDKLVEERRDKVLHYGEFLDLLGKITKRVTKRSIPDNVKIIDIEREDFYTQRMIKAHLESEGIDETQLYKCEKEWDKDKGKFRVKGGCGFVPLKDYVANFYACPKCGKGEYLNIDEQIEKICDKNTFTETECNLTINDLSSSERYNLGRYKALLEKMQKKSFSKEGLVTGTAKIHGKDVVLVISDIHFIGGSFGAAFGEKFKRAVDLAIKKKFPMISLCSSGGARMNEGPMALAQMAKMNMSILDLKKAGILYLSVIAEPTTGGAYASYASQGDVMIGEKGSLVEFAGPRVVLGAGFEVDREVVCTDNLYETKKIQHLVDRKDLKNILSYYVDIFYGLKYPNKRQNSGRIRDFRKLSALILALANLNMPSI